MQFSSVSAPPQSTNLLLALVSTAALGATVSVNLNVASLSDAHDISTAEGRQALVRLRLDEWRALVEPTSDELEMACADYAATITWPEGTSWWRTMEYGGKRFQLGGNYQAWAEHETDTAMNDATQAVVVLIARDSTPMMSLPDPSVTGKEVYKSTMGSFETFRELAERGDLDYAKPTLAFTDGVVRDLYNLSDPNSYVG